MIRIGNKLLERCPVCGEIVTLNKWLFGSGHFCLTNEEEKHQKYRFPPLRNDELLDRLHE